MINLFQYKILLIAMFLSKKQRNMLIENLLRMHG